MKLKLKVQNKPEEHEVITKSKSPRNKNLSAQPTLLSLPIVDNPPLPNSSNTSPKPTSMVGRI